MSRLSFRTRRTIKPAAMNSHRVVPNDTLLEILEDAHWAPTHGLTQPWRFHVFTGDSREKLAAALPALYDQIVPPAEHREDKREKLRTQPMLAPVCIAIAARIDPHGKISELDEIAATSCAVQNLMLSAHEHGLGTFWSTPPVACSGEFAAWLGLDASHRAMGIVYLGYAQAGSPPVSIRHPLASRVVFH